MGHRLSKIYTRTGDKGTTGLGDGSRVDKDSLRVEAYGSVDELNSIIGLLVTHEMPAAITAGLVEIEHDLFDMGGELCIPGHSVVTDKQVERLEQLLDSLNAELAPLKEFILPGGAPAAAVCHMARTVCRRAERRVVSLAREQSISEPSLRYLNRLSDLLFVMSRSLNHAASVDDVLWQRGKNT
ncbi:ATP:Cob(I)alamin adenosyltransferase [hydrothermal vent metagenome]|uniref:ATP:Cob(I)alamin adenosyltransferase n=1 Tax=hydrothermal vent metagenome TaxID=652676 RepID=A0A3B0Z408_9ZZZZ